MPMSVSAPHTAMIFDHAAVARMGGRIPALLIGSTEYAPGENTPLLVGLIVLLGLFGGSGYVLYRAIRWLIAPTIVPHAEYACRPPQLTHRCGPPRSGRVGTRWTCPVCGCPWIVVRGPARMERVVELGPGTVWTPSHGLRYRPVSRGDVYWTFDRATYNA